MKMKYLNWSQWLMKNSDFDEYDIVWRMALTDASVDPQTSNQPQGEPQDGENHDKAVSCGERGWANQDTAVSGGGDSVDPQTENHDKPGYLLEKFWPSQDTAGVGYKPNSNAPASFAKSDFPWKRARFY